MKIAASALNAAPDLGGDSIREALLNAKIDGVMGEFSFTPNRDPAVTSGVLVLEVAGGKFTILK